MATSRRESTRRRRGRRTLTFIEQWLTVAGSACPLGLEFSNALQVTLQ